MIDNNSLDRSKETATTYYHHNKQNVSESCMDALHHMVLGGWKLDENGGDKMIAERNRMIVAKL